MQNVEMIKRNKGNKTLKKDNEWDNGIIYQLVYTAEGQGGGGEDYSADSPGWKQQISS